MIYSRFELKKYIEMDFNHQKMKHPFIARFTYGEHAYIKSYLEMLRKLEYYKNNSYKPFHKILFLFYNLLYRKKCLDTGIYIAPNTCGPGLFLPHPGFIRIDSFCHIGCNCTILPMVLFGKVRPGIDCEIIVGDNCYISTGVTILGPITIGNNVTIAAGAVVLDNVPDNCVVAGVPARIVKYK